MDTIPRALIALTCSTLPLATGRGPSTAGGLSGRDAMGEAEQHYLFFAEVEPRCRLVLPAEPEQEEREAAELVRNLFRDMGGGEADIVNDPVPTSLAFNGVDIHVGRTDFAKGLALLPPDMDDDGFVIHPADAGRLVLLGGRPVSTFYAATEFLERYAGILWVWPGEHGTVIPKTDRFEATVRQQRSEPAFLSRHYHGVGDKLAYYRIHQTRRERRIRFHHNVRQVMPAGMYAEHPAYFNFSRWHGKRMDPGASIAHWQACTTNPGVIQLFTDAAKRQFAAEPWVRSFSVSQNDGDGFCECDECRALDVPGVSGFSDRYFTFVNAVADGIRDEFPDKLIACFAYSATVDPPVRLKLRPNVFICAVVPTLKDPHRSITEWSKVAPHLGAYFWLHGKAVPKFYPRRWAEYLRFLRRHSVIHVNAEVYQDNPQKWASWELDGPRVWITSKLVWNPEADIDELMDRFCRGFYGPAAEPMLRYYRQCETAWERREDPFDFGRAHASREFELYSAADMEVMEDCVRQALALAKGDTSVTARLKALETRLRPVAGYVRQLDLVNTLHTHVLRSRADAETVVAKVREVEAAERRMTGKGLSLFGTLLHKTEMAIDDCFHRITELLDEEAAAFWRNVKETNPELRRFAALQLLDISGTVADNALMPVPADKEADAEPEWLPFDLPGWPPPWIGEGGGTVGIATKVARTGGKSLVITEARNACGIYMLSVNAGERYRVSVWAKTSVKPKEGQKRTGGSFILRWQGRHGWIYDTEVPLPLPAGTSEWTHLSSVVTVPLDVPRLGILLGAENQAEGEQTWFDDLCIEKL